MPQGQIWASGYPKGLTAKQPVFATHEMPAWKASYKPVNNDTIRGEQHALTHVCVA